MAYALLTRGPMAYHLYDKETDIKEIYHQPDLHDDSKTRIYSVGTTHG